MGASIARNDGKNKILMVLVSCAFLFGVGSLIVSPLIPVIADTLHFSPEDGSLLITAFSLLYALTAPLLGPLTDSWGRKKMMVAGAVIFGVGNVSTALADSFSTLVLFRTIAGLGGAMMMPSVFALVGDTFSYETRGKAMGAVTGAMGAATVIGIPLGGFFAQLGSWRATFWMVGFLSLLTLLMILLILPKETIAKTVTPQPLAGFLQQFRTALGNPSARFSLLSTFLWWTGFQGMFGVLGIFYDQNFHLPIATIGLYFSIAGLGNLIGSAVGGRISDKIGKKMVVKLGCLLSAISVFSIPYMHGWMSIVVLLHLMFAFAIGLGQASLNTLISELAPQVRGTIMSLNSSVTYLGMTFASGFSPLLLKQGSFFEIGIVCAASFLLVLVIISRLVREKTSLKQQTS